MMPARFRIHSQAKINSIPVLINLKELLNRKIIGVEDQVINDQLIRFLGELTNQKDEIEVLTSGSTSAPKPIKINKNALIASAQATGDFLKLKPKDSALLCLPLDYIAGKMMLVRALVLGLNLTIRAASNQPLKNETKGYDFSAMVPYQVSQSLSKLSLIKTLIVGGAPISHSLNKQLKLIPSTIYETFGMTETISHIAMRNVHDNVFKALKGVELSLTKQNCLLINAPRVTSSIIETNDVVELISNKAFLWLARKDFIINSGGIKVYPEQVEKKLSEALPEESFIIASVKDKLLGERVVLLSKLKEKIPNSIFENRLERYQKPKAVYLSVPFFYTKSGKINRVETIREFRKKFDNTNSDLKWY